MMNRLPNNPFVGSNGVVVMAHRGGSGRWPENTMLAFENAVRLGVDALETDIHSTAEGVLVVAHDPDVDRVTDGNGRIQDHTLAQLKKLDAGYRWTADDGKTYPFRGQGITIPTLEELFAAFPNMWINIDVKQSEPPIVSQFLQMVHDFDMVDKVLVGSFNTKTVAQLRRECPELATAASEPEARRLFVLSKLRLERFYSGGCVAFQLPEYDNGIHVVTKRLVEAAHKRKTAVHVWTVDEVEQMKRLIALGVDCLMTDFPDRLLELVGR